MLRSLQNIVTNTMEGAQGRFDAFLSSMQSSYDIMQNNRNELAPGVTVPEPEDGTLQGI